MQHLLYFFLLRPIVENFVKNVSWDTVDLPSVGSVVYCGILFGHIEHSGIYVGDGCIVSLSPDGRIVKQNPRGFLDGLSTGDTIYVSCKGESPVGRKEVAERALKMVGRRRGYNFLFGNCHQFTSGCLTGNYNNADSFFWMLRDTAKQALGADTWRASNMRD